MTSVIHAVEARRPELDGTAFGILKTVVDSFRSFGTENTNPLTIYESQFAIAIRSSFPSSIDASADFHMAYIEVFMSNFDANPKGCLILLENYVRGLKLAEVRTAGFFAIASQLCVIAEKIDRVFRGFESFLQSLAPLFSAILFDSVRLRTSGTDWSGLSAYRARIAPFYHSLLRATVWLRHVFPVSDSLTATALAAFFLLELTSASEPWRSYAAFGALTSLLRYQAVEVDAPLRDLAVSTVCQVTKWNAQLFRALIPDFLAVATALQPDDPQIWVALACTALGGTCSAPVIARILRSAPPDLVVGSVLQFVDLALSELGTRDVSADQAVALLTIIYEKCPGAIPAIIGRIIGVPGNTAFKLRAIERAYARVETRSAIDGVARFFVETLQPETMKVIGRLALVRPTITVEILRRGVLQKFVDPGFELGHGLPFFWFALLALDQLGKTPGVACELAQATLRAFVADGNDRENGEQIAALTAQLLAKADQADPRASATAFRLLGASGMAEATRFLQKHTSKKVFQKVSLVKFAAQTRKRSEDDWQSADLD
jgi:hypothetical protein